MRCPISAMGLLTAAYALTQPIPVAAQQGDYHALLIANERYTDWEPLSTPHEDADALAAVLERRYGFASVRMIKDVTRDRIIDEFEALKTRVDSDDSVLIYFAGHGNLRADGGYWVGVDADQRSRSRWLHYRTINDLIDYESGMKARHVLVVADSCYAGAVLRGGEQKEGSADRDRRAWIARQYQYRSRKAFTSGGTEPVLDRAGGDANSVFAGRLVDVLASNRDVIEAERVFDLVKEDVHARARRVMGDEAQAPAFGTIHGTGDLGGGFIFVPTGASIEAPTSEPGGNDGDFGIRGGGDPDNGNGGGTIRLGAVEQTVWQQAGPIHLGDEGIRQWPPLAGQCLDASFRLDRPPQTLTLRFEAYGAENTLIDFNGAIYPSVFSMDNKPGKKRPNYWSDAFAIELPTAQARTGDNRLRICSEPVRNPEFTNDVDDFQLRDVTIATR